ncbi:MULTISPECIES: flagellar export chaperone FliS [Borrelia]|uniref:Flagellar secretion chaperone FliS n=2 Tax=Borrelia turicatae TaxID=142 RepID=A0A172XBH0_BORTU|nr:MULTISPECIES: flagellar export chaperone FliS [Borrelia]AAX17874.1 flagellar protein FliS [Borrelia turicatae 91E135]ANF34011.1 flagellar export chaperone FliS [Borrelia turicatae]UPA12211.1 flagellar export chaperone FliS [Borrelia venezuelensis]UPA13383.1 flagellar export chaperone FliS [Borrelia turicatae 91E135]UPA14868.1 flagellar export chaperone FliS [Borrelia turicatae]
MIAKEEIYKKTQINTSSPISILVMLYEKAIQDLELAKEFYKSKDPTSTAKADEKVYHAQDIIIELMSTLNFEDGGDISNNLFSIYSFLNKTLENVILEKNRDNIQEVLKHLKNLHTAWKALLKKDNNIINKKLGINIVN